jgi:hypothetical protein
MSDQIDANSTHCPSGVERDRGGEQRSVSWSIRLAIELLDEAIDRMGTQLAQAASAPMTWEAESPADQLKRLGVGKHRALADLTDQAHQQLCELSGVRGPELP